MSPDHAQRTLVISACVVAALIVSAPPVAAQPYAYVTNNGSDSVAVIDTAFNTVVTTLSVDQGPVAIAITPDGSQAWVSNSYSSTISVIDTTTNTLITDNVAGPYIYVSDPAGLTFLPDSTRAYVAAYGGDEVVAIEASALIPGANVPGSGIAVGYAPISVAMTPDGTRIYVTNHFSFDLSVIDTATNLEVDTFDLGPNTYPNTVAITPDGTRAYVTDVVSSTVYAVDIATNTVVAPTAGIPVGPGPYSLAISPDGTEVYVPTGEPAGVDGSISVIDTTTNTVVSSITLPGFVRGLGVAFTPDGSHAYVTNCGFSSNVLVIDTATRTVVGSPIAVGSCPIGVAITPHLSTPEEGIQALIEDVSDLLAAEILSQGQANSLLSKLEHSLEKLALGKTRVAINQLGAFLSQAESLVADGVLTAAEGQALIDAADALILQLDA